MVNNNSVASNDHEMDEHTPPNENVPHSALRHRPSADGAARPNGAAVAAQAARPPSIQIAVSSVPGRPPFGQPILTLRNVRKSFPIDNGKSTVTALSNITLSDDDPSGFPSIRQGEFVMIRGPSGGGKTTLLNIVGTIDGVSSGHVELLQTVIDDKSGDDFLADLRLRHIGFVFQTFNLLATMTACENVELPMTLLGELTEKERKRRAKQLLALVGLRNRIDHLPSELSGGEQQRVTIARALANNPAMLLLDEPTGDLDTATTIEIMDLLMRLNHMVGTTCIMVTHNPDLECYADRILYVSDGCFAQQVLNERPQELCYEAYQAYLQKRDRQLQQGFGDEAVVEGAVVANGGGGDDGYTSGALSTDSSAQQRERDGYNDIKNHPHQPTSPNRAPNHAASTVERPLPGTPGASAFDEQPEPVAQSRPSTNPASTSNVSVGDRGDDDI